MPSIGEYLKEARGEKTLGQISAVSGIDKGYLSKVERNERKPKPEMLGRLAGAYHVDYGHLMRLCGYVDAGGEDGPIPPEFLIMARKTGDLSEEQKRQVYKMLDDTIDRVLEDLEQEARDKKEEA